MTDPLARLGTLPTAEPSVLRSARIQQRARQALQRQPSPAPPPGSNGDRRRAASPLWLAAAASLGLAYLAEVVVLAARVLASR